MVSRSTADTYISHLPPDWVLPLFGDLLNVTPLTLGNESLEPVGCHDQYKES
jgi:hypothetical protein